MNHPSRTPRKRKIIAAVISMILAASLCSAGQPAFVEESVDAYNKRMQWFADAQYGMFIHFGLYSQLGGEYKGKLTAKNQKYSEWIQAHLEIPREEYAEIAKDFNPAQFDADLIASTAKAAGMKYLVITSKHHDGFCLWDSEFTDFDTKEQRHFEEAFPKHWEACYTMNKSWGYKKGDDDWKDAATVYEKLKDVNEKGGNLLLNVGPDGNGVVQQEAISILLETGKLIEAKPIQKQQPKITAVPRLVQKARK